MSLDATALTLTLIAGFRLIPRLVRQSPLPSVHLVPFSAVLSRTQGSDHRYACEVSQEIPGRQLRYGTHAHTLC